MMRAMLEAAVNWMKAGLPLKKLRIVLYSTNPNKIQHEDQDVIQIFERVKRTLEEERAHPEQVISCCFMSYSATYHLVSSSKII